MTKLTQLSSQGHIHIVVQAKYLQKAPPMWFVLNYRALLTGFWGKLFRVCPSSDPEPSISIFSKNNITLN